MDVLARISAQKLTESWGQQVVADNRPGASGIIGNELAARAVPDGYTLLMGTLATHAFNVALYKNLPYSPIRDFAPVALVATVPNVLVVNPSLPVKSVKELIALATQRPGALSYASAGPGSSLHLSAELFKGMARIDIVHVPYKGSTPAVTDVMAGQVPMMFDSITSSLPHVNAGKLRVLAITTSQRSAGLPHVPTIAEAGLPGYEMNPWYGILAPVNTPPAIVAALNAELVRIIGLPETRQRFAAIGAEPIGGTPEKFGELIKVEIAKWAKVIQGAGITLD
jgi:tripartite-type tricarboxylate transporter receptor subunit TctC